MISVKEAGPSRRVSIFGANPEHVTGIRQIIWDYSGNYIFLTTAENLSVVSDNANDTSIGTGARTIRISGLDSNYNEIEEVVNLDGTTPVLTSLQFLRRNRIQVNTVGSAGQNIGNITIEGSSVQGYILSGVNRDRTAVYTIPANFIGQLKQVFASVGPAQSAAGTKYGDVDFAVREFGGQFRFTNAGFVTTSGNQHITIFFGNSRDFSEKTDMSLQLITEKEGTASQGFFELYLENM